MPDLLGATNPVPGYDKSVTNRVMPGQAGQTGGNLPLQNVVDPSRVSRADGRTDRQDSNLQGEGNVRYDSNFQTFLQRLRETPDLSTALRSLFSGREGTVVLSGMQDGVAGEMSNILEMLRMDEKQLLDFLMGQSRLGTRFGGALFALLRNAHAQAGSETLRLHIEQFLKCYSDYSSSQHIQGNMLRNLSRMADAMPGRWAESLRTLLAQLENSLSSGDRQGSLQLLQKQIFPYMGSYVEQTHDMGLPRELLSMLALDVARFENGSEENLMELFHQLRGYGTLRDTLRGLDEQSLLTLLRQAASHGDSAAARFSDSLASAALQGLRGEAGVEAQERFQNLVSAMLLNESVYMPVNHYLLPLEWNGRLLFSEMWVDPDAEHEQTGGGGEKTSRFLLKIDVQSLGLFDVILSSRKDEVDVRISCPPVVAPMAKQIEEGVAQILARNALTPVNVEVRQMDRPVSLTSVFPKIYDGRSGVNVKV